MLSVKETRKKVGRWDWKLPEPGQSDALLDLIEDPQALAQLGNGQSGATEASATRAGAEPEDRPSVATGVGRPAPSKKSEDQKVPEDLGTDSKPPVAQEGPRENRAQRRAREAAERRRSEDSKVQNDSTRRKRRRERAERLRHAPMPDRVGHAEAEVSGQSP